MKAESAIVFGGASGLGEATARTLAEAGHKVMVADLNEEKGVELVGKIGGTFVKADVTDEESVHEAIAAAAGPGVGGASGGLRICVNCAGVGAAGRIIQKGEPAALDGYKWVIDINLIGTINVLSQAAAAMVGNDPDEDGQRGICINTASIAAYDGQIGQTAYAASKGGVVGLTLPAARDLARDGVRVMTIAPGLFDTPLLALLPEPARKALGETVPFPPRLGVPPEFAALALHIVDNVMLNGEVIRLDGALRMAPK
ncbi:MAG: SDR family NAD(P)-dependent oxidoreductase [Solirubrobacterales bacterium]|nr:SDR family NAD(P)-dependent oxidoreductase [Solirubrobacterales bacterium]